MRVSKQTTQKRQTKLLPKKGVGGLKFIGSLWLSFCRLLWPRKVQITKQGKYKYKYKITIQIQIHRIVVTLLVFSTPPEKGPRRLCAKRKDYVQKETTCIKKKKKNVPYVQKGPRRLRPQQGRLGDRRPAGRARSQLI